MSSAFSLKDHLFNPVKVRQLARELEQAWPAFPRAQFEQRVIQALPDLELKQRIAHIRSELAVALPQDYPKALKVILEALPAPCDPALSDDDFGDYIYAPYSDFVAHYGCSEAYFDLSMAALREITTRFSAEHAVRPFLTAFPQRAQKTLKQWAKDSHYHVRRLVSEGTRPSLPWSRRLDWPPEQCLGLLDLLYDDPTRYVTRSVANHLNDWSKKHPELVIARLKRWRAAGQQKPKELDYITRHALRSLIKQGHPQALELLGFSPEPQIEIQAMHWTQEVILGERLSFDFELHAQADQALMVDYCIGFWTARGEQREKVFKLKQLRLQNGERAVLKKQHPLRQMTTKKLYPGPHYFALQINGQRGEKYAFELRE